MSGKFDYTDDVGKYRRKKKSNISRSSEKSDHKHQYTDCLLKYTYMHGYTGYTRAEYCSVCGKLNNKGIKFFEVGPDHKILSPDETKEKYKHLPMFELDFIRGKAVDLDLAIYNDIEDKK